MDTDNLSDEDLNIEYQKFLSALARKTDPEFQRHVIKVISEGFENLDLEA